MVGLVNKSVNTKERADCPISYGTLYMGADFSKFYIGTTRF